MNKATYIEKHDVPYIGKHAKKMYKVYRVLGPAGPEEILEAYGLDEVRQLISGCWDWEVVTLDGKEVNI